MSEVFERVNREMAAIVEHVRPSLVQLRNGRRGMGAGTVWHADGLIVTNAHVVQQRAPQATLSDGRTVSTHVVAMDTEHDLAALCVAATGLTAVTLAEPYPLQPGHWVLALGHPWGGAGAITAGIGIGIGASPERPQRQGEWIHVDLHLRPGYWPVSIIGTESYATLYVTDYTGEIYDTLRVYTVYLALSGTLDQRGRAYRTGALIKILTKFLCFFSMSCTTGQSPQCEGADMLVVISM